MIQSLASIQELSFKKTGFNFLCLQVIILHAFSLMKNVNFNYWCAGFQRLSVPSPQLVFLGHASQWHRVELQVDKSDQDTTSTCWVHSFLSCTFMVLLFPDFRYDILGVMYCHPCFSKTTWKVFNRHLLNTRKTSPFQHSHKGISLTRQWSFLKASSVCSRQKYSEYSTIPWLQNKIFPLP